MATTPNFGWETPDDTDYVKDGAAAMRTLGNAIDASLMDLEGGTTGQVLSKNSNTDMDFVWITPNDADAIQNTIVDAKGDLITATAADTPARLAVGTNGQVLTADSTTATGLKWASAAAGGMTLLSTTTASSTTTVITGIDQTYNNLQIHITGLSLNSLTNGPYFGFRNSSGVDLSGGSVVGLHAQGTTLTNRHYAAGYIYYDISLGNAWATAGANTIIIDVFDYASTNQKIFRFNSRFLQDSGSQINITQATGQLSSTNAISQFFAYVGNGTTNWTGGTIKIYGVK